MADSIRVLCVDDSPDIGDLYCALIDAESDMECVGRLTSALEVVKEVKRTKADCVLLDLTMPGGPDPLAVIQELSELHPESRVLAFSGYDDEATKNAVLDAGAWGFVSKNVEAPDVVDAIRRVVKGEVVLPR